MEHAACLTADKSQRGSLFIESLSSLTMIMIFMVGLFPLIAYSSAVKVTNHHRALATAVINGELEIVRSMPYDSIGLPSSNPKGTLNPERDVTKDGVPLHIRTRVWWASPDGGSDPAAYKTVQITVLRRSDGKVLGSAAATITRQGPPAVGSGAHLRVRVKRADGAPIPDAVVSITTGPSSPMQGRTSSDGTIVFANLEPSATEGDYSVTASYPGYVVRPDQAIQTTTMYYNELRELEFNLEPPGRLVVNLFDASTGDPIETASTLKLNNPSSGLQTYNSNNGTFKIENVYPGTYDVTATASSYAPGSPGGPVTVSPSQTTTVAIHLTPRPSGILHLEVLDSSTNARIVPDDIVITRKNNGEALRYFANDQGILDTEMEVGDYTLSVSKNGYNGATTDPLVITKDTTSSVIVKLTKAPTTGDLRVRTQNKNGQAYSLVNVKVTGPNGYSSTKLTGVIPDPAGEATFKNLKPGEYTVYRYSWGWKYPVVVQVIAGKEASVVYTY